MEEKKNEEKKQRFACPGLKNWSNKILSNQILVSLFVFLLAAAIVFIITITQYGYTIDFLKNVLVEAHGMLFDILIIGTLIFALHKLGEKQFEKRLKIQRWLEEIDDFRGWDEKEATFRIVGNIRRLNKLKITRIDISSCYFEKADFIGADLTGANLIGANLSRANIWGVNLSGANLLTANLVGADLASGTNLSGANLTGANLRDAKLSGTDLGRADLHEADLTGAELWCADFTGANLLGAILLGTNLRDAKWLTLKQLSTVKTLYEVELDPSLLKQVKQKYPHLLEKPKEKKR